MERDVLYKRVYMPCRPNNVLCCALMHRLLKAHWCILFSTVLRYRTAASSFLRLLGFLPGSSCFQYFAAPSQSYLW